MMQAATALSYSNTVSDRISITITMLMDVGWSREQCSDLIRQWLAAMTLTGGWWEQSEEWQERLYAAMHATWEREFIGCADF